MTGENSMKLVTFTLVVLIACLTLPASSQAFHSIYSFQGGSDGAAPQLGGLINRGGILYGTTSSGGGTGCGGQGCGTVFAITPNGGGWTERVIYAFSGGSDGASPVSGLLNVMLNFNGKFYGTTTAGGGTGCGGAGCGTIFTLTPPASLFGRWIETVVYSFAGGNDGWQPVAPLLDVSGTLYGVTAYGGGGSGCFQNFGCGTVFSFNLATGAERVVHAFQGSDGSNPYGGLLNIGNVLYGTTYRGGAGTGCVEGYGCGTAFRIDETTGALTVLHSFSASGSDGASPQAALISVGGTLYGTTNLDGTGGCAPPYGCGTVFAMDPNTGIVTPLHQFTGGTDGQHPTAPMIQLGGLLYGTTQGGFTPNTGAVFQIDPTTGDEGLLYEFTGGGSDGAAAIAPLLNVGGTLYSTTESGGLHVLGTVYSITP